jgi:BirA family biotin operon repressor/biotin-[acetyl-CoA-carboxylase] ligase
MFESLPDDLAGALSAAAPRLGGFGRLHFRAETASTNDDVIALAQAGAADGTSVLADAQRAGRGRRGHTWFSPPGAGLYLSVCVHVGSVRMTLSLVTLAAGVAAAEAVTAATGLPVELKWPNDLVVGRPWRKLGGLLCESVGSGGRIDAVVVGLGVNRLTAAYPPELTDRATSIERELDRPVPRAPLVVEYLARLRERLEVVRAGDDDAICRAWRRLGAAGLGASPVRWHDQGVEKTGLARDIDARGALVVESGGRMEQLIAGDVTWDRLSHG